MHSETLKSRSLHTTKLRHYVPLGSPARREAADGTETVMRVSLGFELAWYHQRCGVDFSQRWHTDPYYRYEALKRMKAEVLEAFPAATCWDRSSDVDLASISGCYGIYPIPHACGIPIQYAPDRYPELASRRLSVKEIEQLTVRQIVESPVFADVFRQMECIEREWGAIHGYLSWQGVLNNAFHIRGQEIFLDMYDKPDFVHQFFSLLTEVLIQLAQCVQARQRESGFFVNHFTVSNCVLNMISPQAYEDFVLPYDTRVAHSFERFGVHTCEWDVTPYLEVLRKLPKMGFLDMGMMSDMARVTAMFPDTRRAVLYSPVKLQEASLDEIRQDMEQIWRELAPCDVAMPEIQPTTPDSRVKALLEICRALETQS
ncbi:hypothetical protein GF339_11255 [candidate division KSB3 bacterium]|uniref:Uroporphyrinogen decarboxylase (URO-D) domain-containing protein n=1 Tax=candidate division KSB3 bacterium TaxID=2044937 RepID=A0A9D5Q5T2_9BACT|nr:hypothetical protein [candidate division KSB3 bacterium]MBD3325154.1 hypothetical protein [candidate division KSB3 bacterium]